jgi:hypothetical protein
VPPDPPLEVPGKNGLVLPEAQHFIGPRRVLPIYEGIHTIVPQPLARRAILFLGEKYDGPSTEMPTNGRYYNR